MRNLGSLRGLILLSGLPLLACDSEPRTEHDPEIGEPVGRIVSLVPSATRTLQALHVSDLLVGRTDFDTMGGIAHLPSVGGGLDPNPEALLLLDPDLVIRFDGQADPATPDVLEDLGLPTLTVRLDHVADVRAMILELGSITESQARAEELVEEMERALGEVRSLVANRTPRRVAYVLGGNPPWVAGADTFIHEILAAAGGENVFSDLEALYGPVSPEEFLVRNIEVLLAPEGVEVLVPSDEVSLIRVSPALELPGPDLARAIQEVAKLLHPEVFR